MKAGETESYLKQYFWQSGGTITSAQALLGADALTHAAVEALAAAKKVLIEIPQGWVAMELRFYSDAAANTEDVLELYAASTSDSNPDHYRHFAQLTTLVGTQEYGSNKFIDTITPANEAWLTRNNEISPANNTFGSYVLNTHGYSNILVIASTLNSTTFGVEYKKV
jgi:hypothetical protein